MSSDGCIDDGIFTFQGFFCVLSASNLTRYQKNEKYFILSKIPSYKYKLLISFFGSIATWFGRLVFEIIEVILRFLRKVVQ